MAVLLAAASLAYAAAPATDPLTLKFHRQAIRRFVFSNNIPLTRLAPAEIVALELMHPVMPGDGQRCVYSLGDGVLHITAPVAGESALYVGGVNPFATCQIDVRSIETTAPLEIAIELATMDRSTRVQLVCRYPADRDSVRLRLVRDHKVIRQQVFRADRALEPPYILRAQLSGVSLSAFVTKDGRTSYLGHTTPGELFGDVIDFRSRKIIATSSFNVFTSLPAGAKVTLGGAESFLSAGLGQADIRPITRRDGAPIIEDGRLFFTFSARGLNISDSFQGVMSLNPSTFDMRFEGAIVYDRGDGLLRNDYSSHVFYDDDAREWRSFASCFSVDKAGRGPTGLALGRSRHDPRRGFSVLQEKLFTGIQAEHEDPCIIHDEQAGKWRLLTTRLEGMRAMLFEADNWDGPYRHIAGPVDRNSTGTLIQKIGQRRYVFCGSSDRAVYIYSYPDLKMLGTLNMDLPPWLPEGNGRVWPNVFPLPAGYPARYMALMMDRPNFPGVRGGNWSYGALHLYWADTDSIDGEAFEYPLPPGPP